jgi:MOSC domain-containing protein YiiM
MATGRVLGIYTAPAEGAPMVAHESIAALAGRGLAGDRYAIEAGTYSGTRLEDAQRAITLFARETLDAVAAEHGIVLRPEETRRNLLVEGVPLDDLLGVTFTVGDVPLRGVDLAHPCRYLEGLTQPGVLRALVDRGGLRCEILADGTITVGDPVTTPG